MKITNLFKKLSIAILSLVLISSCSKEDEVLEKKMLEIEPIIEKIYTEVSDHNGTTINSSNTSYILFAKLNLTGGMPDELYINDYILTDDGKYQDKVAGDGIYTVYKLINSASLDHRIGTQTLIFGENNSIIDSDGTGVNEEQVEPCKIRLASPGEKCAGGTCPKESILGGETWWCLCISNCDPMQG